MYFFLVRRRVNRVAIPTNQLGKILPLRADIHIINHHSEFLGRVSTQAWVFNSTPGPDVIPRLHDAKANVVAQLGMNINEVEEVDGVLYAQSWWFRA